MSRLTYASARGAVKENISLINYQIAISTMGILDYRLSLRISCAETMMGPFKDIIGLTLMLKSDVLL